MSANKIIIIKSEFIIITSILVMIIILSFCTFYEYKRKTVVENVNYLAFIYHLGLSNNTDGVYIINYDQALNIQKDVIKNLNCSRDKDYCFTFDDKLVSGAFIEISYINNKVDYLKIYSKKIGFIFNNNVAMEPYSKGLFPPESITQSESFRVGRPNTLVIADMMNHVKHEYYNEYNLGKRITEEECMLAKNQCFDVLFYEKNPA
jgi:hypothetical protein